MTIYNSILLGYRVIILLYKLILSWLVCLQLSQPDYKFFFLQNISFWQLFLFPSLIWNNYIFHYNYISTMYIIFSNLQVVIVLL